MVGMVIDRPMSEHYLRVLAFQQTMKFLIVCLVHDGSAIMLSGKRGPGLKNLASPRGLAYANGAYIMAGPVGPIAPVEIQQHDFMVQIRIASNRAAAPILRIAGMAAGDDHFGLRLCDLPTR